MSGKYKELIDRYIDLNKELMFLGHDLPFCGVYNWLHLSLDYRTEQEYIDLFQRISDELGVGFSINNRDDETLNREIVCFYRDHRIFTIYNKGD